MAQLAQVIADKFLGQQINLLRLSVSEREKVLSMLGGLQARLLSTMDAQIPLPGFGTFTTQRLNALYRLTDTLIKQQYDLIRSRHNDTLIDVSGFQGAQARKLVNAVVGVPLMTVGVPLATMKALINDDLVDGRPAAYWWDQQAATLKTRYRDEIRMGAFAGDTLGQLKQRIRGTKAQNYQDGLMALTSRQADALIRTSLLSVANAARHETFKANDDVLNGQQWLSTLDDRTCEICMALDGAAWSFDGEPLGETVNQDFPGPPPQHFNCRCTLVPALKSWAQLQREAGQDDALGKKLDRIEEELGPGRRASMSGDVSAKLTYEDWLRNQDVMVQKDVLGPRRFDLWNRGLIDVQDLVDQQNRPLTLDQIKQRAGIDLQAQFEKDRAAQERQLEEARQAALDKEMEKAVAEANAALAAKPRADFDTANEAADVARLVDQQASDEMAAQLEKKADRQAAARKAMKQGAGIGETISGKRVSKVTSNEREASSGSYVITFDDGSRAMFKPKDEESPKLRQGVKAGTYYQREAVAYDIAKIMDLDDLMPETVILEVNGKLGSVQAFVERASSAGDLYGSERMFGNSPEDIQRATLFDAIMGNTDRHAGNWMVRHDNKIQLIDHGLILPTDNPHLRINFIGGKGKNVVRPGHVIPDDLKQEWADKWDEVEAAMYHRKIPPAAIRDAERRLERIMEPGMTWGELEQPLDGDD
jgi:phage putative head morphogenesis protein, SPP1 gp7 family